MFSTPIIVSTDKERNEYTRDFIYSFLHPYCPDHPNPFFEDIYKENTGLKFNYSEVNFADHLWNGTERGLNEKLAVSLFQEAGYYEAVDIPTTA